MNGKEDAILADSDSSNELFDFDELEKKLETDLNEQLSDLEIIKEDREKINNPDSLGSTVMNVVWEQFINQVGVVAGEDFIAENRGLTLDLRNKAHIQTTENFADGKIATHNDKIDYQQRYGDWQSNFKVVDKKADVDKIKKENNKIRAKNDKIRADNAKNGVDIQKGTRHEIIIDKNNHEQHYDERSQTYKEVLKEEARKPFDKGRPKGSGSKQMDHTVSAAEIIRDPKAAAHLSREEQVAFANSDTNLNLIDSSANQSKRDSTTTEWLDSERNGQNPAERFDIDEDQLRGKDKEAREEYEKQKKEGEERSIKTGKQSQKEEAFRIGGKALRAVVMGLLAELIRNIISKLIAWIRSGEKNLGTFIDQIKNALTIFIGNLKQNVLTAGNTLVTTIATAIIGPIVGTIKKAWMLLKQGAKSLKEALDYIKNPSNKNKPVGILMLEVGKIMMSGLTAAGALVLGEVIEKGLMAIPVFTVEIPLIGSLANILGMFLGALVSGLIGALALNLIDKVVAKKQKENNTRQQIDKGNEILNTQAQITDVADEKLRKTKSDVQTTINDRHKAAAVVIKKATDNIFNTKETNNDAALEQIDQLLNGISEE